MSNKKKYENILYGLLTIVFCTSQFALLLTANNAGILMSILLIVFLGFSVWFRIKRKSVVSNSHIVSLLMTGFGFALLFCIGEFLGYSPGASGLVFTIFVVPFLAFLFIQGIFKIIFNLRTKNGSYRKC